MDRLRKLFLLALMAALSFAATLTPRPLEASHHCYCYTYLLQCCECDPRTAKLECSEYCGC